LQYTKNALFTSAKINLISEKKHIFPLFLENLKIFDASKLQKTRFLSLY
jgi:hypothetical protein